MTSPFSGRTSSQSLWDLPLLSNPFPTFVGRRFLSPASSWAALFLNLRLPPSAYFLITAAAIGAVTWLLATHWAAYCTSSPLKRATAASLRNSWNGYLLLLGLVPAAVVLVSFLTCLPVAAGMLLIVIAYQLVVTTVATHRQGGVLAAWLALVSWLTYNRSDADPPGIFRSPAGSWPARLAVTGLCVFLVAATLNRGLVEAYRSAAISAACPTVPTAPPSDDPARFQIDPPGLDGTVVGIGYVMLAVAIPLAFTLAVPLALALPILAQANDYRNNEVNFENWPDLIR